MITTGGDRESFCETGNDRYRIVNLLEPYNQTAKVCNMHYLPPFVIHGTYKMKPEDCEKNGLDYGLFLDYLEKNKLQTTEISSYEYMNDWFFTKQN